MAKHDSHHAPREEDQDIISERNLYRSYPVTSDDVEEAIECEKLQVIHSASGGRFFKVAEIEQWVGTEDSESEAEEPAPTRRRASARNPEVEDETQSDE